MGRDDTTKVLQGEVLAPGEGPILQAGGDGEPHVEMVSFEMEGMRITIFNVGGGLSLLPEESGTFMASARMPLPQKGFRTPKQGRFATTPDANVSRFPGGKPGRITRTR